MADRFSRIQQAAQLSDAYDNYKLWRDTPREPNPNSRGQQKSRSPVYLHPFGVTFDSGEVYSSKADPDTFAELSAFLAGTGGSVSQTLGGTEKLIAARGFRAARIVWFRNTARTVSTPTSEITKQKYLKYEGDRLSLPFGQESGVDEMMTVFAQAKAAIQASASGTYEISRVSLQRERMAL